MPVALLVIVFAVPSLRGGSIVATEEITELIRDVLMDPWVESVQVLLPVAKLALLAVAIIGVVGIGPYPKIVLAYYASILVVVAIFQNTATLSGGIAVILGNVLTQLIVAAVCIAGLQRTDVAPLRRARLWLVPLMLWAWLYPFGLSGDTVVAGGWSGVPV